MYLDAFTISALVDELMDTIVGGRIQDSVDVEEDAIGMEIYAGRKRHYLLMSANNQVPRVHLVPEKLRRGLPKPTQLGLLFRRMVEGGIIAHVSQPPWERILMLDIEGPEGPVQIVVEPMERRANVLLLQGETVQDCMRRVTPAVNRYRVALPNQPYKLPPPQTTKISPYDLTEDALVAMLATAAVNGQKAQQALTASLLGFSPLLAKEVVHRATGDTNTKAEQTNPTHLFDVLSAQMTNFRARTWDAGMAREAGIPRAFSVYPLTSVAGWERTSGISAAMSAYYTAPTGIDSYNAAKEPVHAAIVDALARLRGKEASLESALKDDSEREVLRQSGELILAYQYGLKGQTELRTAYDVDGPELVIPLDAELTPLENAQRYFERYNKAKRALDDVPTLLAETRAEIATLQQLEMDLVLATNWPEIDEVQQALQASGQWKGKHVQKMGGGKTGPLKHVTDDEFLIYIGRNSRQNEQVTFEKGTAADLWLHARGVPGAHVIIKFDGRRVPDEVIVQAAGFAAYYSGLQGESRAEVDVTERRHVRKMRGAGPGMVTYRNERTLNVEPAPVPKG
ncbi:MAG: NFACT family protein [Pleurocapsa minor GSE-CHR-MK-17-07R]|jgi:predicted ribosome quality control (RQC) complex YloA/Tae2 family protein|nr:NFACT family protein [Pleurocapsa minor GSE-CHR-MK 17-07R]